MECGYPDYKWLHPLIAEFQRLTGSRIAEAILRDWAALRRDQAFVKIVPVAVARKMEDYVTVGANAG